MKIVFFGTDNFAVEVLSELIKHHEVVAVVTVPNAPVGRKQELQESPISGLASELNIPTLKPESLRKDLKIEETLRSFEADVFVVAVYSKIIPQNILNIPPLGNINVHPSLLPQYRGPAPIRTPLLNGDKVTGVSIMLMDKEVDHGPILAQDELLIEPNDTNPTLTDKLAKLAAPLLIKALSRYEKGIAAGKEQDHVLATFTKMVKKEDGKIDWNKPATEIYNQWRAYLPWPGIYTTWNSKLLKITSCSVLPSTFDIGPSTTTPGTALPDGIVTCGSNTCLQILSLQPESKQPMDIKSFLNGNKNFIGSILG